jgi:hypothetical protein
MAFFGVVPKSREDDIYHLSVGALGRATYKNTRHNRVHARDKTPAHARIEPGVITVREKAVASFNALVLTRYRSSRPCP